MNKRRMITAMIAMSFTLTGCVAESIVKMKQTQLPSSQAITHETSPRAIQITETMEVEGVIIANSAFNYTLPIINTEERAVSPLLNQANLLMVRQSVQL